jgi:dodecin
MTEHVYKYVELTGSSPAGIEDAVEKALQRARRTLRNIRWFVVSEIRGQIDEGEVNHWQVTIKVGFTLEE